MTRVFHPYVIGSESPIPHLFENIIPEIANDFGSITTFTNKTDGVLKNPNIKEVFVGDITSVSGAIRYRLKYPLTSLQYFNLIHTGGRPPVHRRMARLARSRNPELAHLHTFRIDVDPNLPNYSNIKKLAKMADRVTAVSKHTAQTAEEVLGVEPEVVYNGVDTEVFNPNYECPEQLENIDDDKRIFLFVGTLEDRKRPGDVVKVAKNVNNCVFIMIGDGEKLNDIREKSKNLDNIEILGRVPKTELPPIYANADGLVFPSIKEGCPNVVMEAMASGLPVIGYRATSMPELVEHLQTGYLAEPRNPTELVEGVKFVTESNKQMGENARSYVKSNHSFDQIAQKYGSIYKEIMKIN